jgi:5-methyltetrahydropteroyltriglutamate--homocysteine methyltransferase
VFEKHPWQGEIGLGVIDVKNPRVEEPEEIVQRVERASKTFDMGKITLVPDCGFSSGRPWPVVTRRIALQKLQAQTEAAQALRKKYS